MSNNPDPVFDVVVPVNIPAAAPQIVEGYTWTLAGLKPWAKWVKPIQLFILPEFSCFMFCTVLPLLLIVSTLSECMAHMHADQMAHQQAVRSSSGHGSSTAYISTTRVARRQDEKFTDWMRSDKGRIPFCRYVVQGHMSLLLWLWVGAREVGILVLLGWKLILENESPTAGYVLCSIFGICWAVSGLVVVCCVFIPYPFCLLYAFLCPKKLGPCAVQGLDMAAFVFGIPATYDGVPVIYSGWKIWGENSQVIHSYSPR